MAGLPFQVAILILSGLLNTCLLGVTEGDISRLELVNHILRVIGCPITDVPFVVLPILCRILTQDSLLALRKCDLHTLVLFLVTLGICTLPQVALTDATMQDIRVSLD